MKGQNVGYIRVSSVGQNTERQLKDIALDKIFEEKVSGKDANRPALTDCLSHLREGDILHIHSIDRLARNLKDLQQIVESLTIKGVTVKFHKENLTFDPSGSANPMQTLMFQMLGAFAEFERTLTNERRREGMAIAKANGVKMGAPSKLSSDQVQEIKKLVADGGDKSAIAKQFGVSRPTLYKLISAGV